MRCYRVKMSRRGFVLAELRIEEYLIRSFSSEIPSFTFTKMYNIKGVAWGARDPPFCKPFLNQTTYNRWPKCHDDTLAILTIWWVPSLWHSVTPPLEKSWLRPWTWLQEAVYMMWQPYCKESALRIWRKSISLILAFFVKGRTLPYTPFRKSMVHSLIMSSHIMGIRFLLLTCSRTGIMCFRNIMLLLFVSSKHVLQVFRFHTCIKPTYYKSFYSF